MIWLLRGAFRSVGLLDSLRTLVHGLIVLHAARHGPQGAVVRMRTEIAGAWGVIMSWPERIKTQPHDDRDNCFQHFDSKGPLRYDSEQ